MRKRILQSDFYGDPNVGMYAAVTDEFCLIGNVQNVKAVKEVLKVPVLRATVGGTDLVGIFVAANSNGVVVPHIITEREMKALKAHDLEVSVIKTKYTALGNMILCNDKGAVVSKLFNEDQVEEIEDCLDVPVEKATVAELPIVGSVGVTSNKGCLLHRDAFDDEADKIEKVLHVKADIGTVNFGSPFVKSGVIVNSNGVVIGKNTSSPEIQRIVETLGFL